MSYKDELKTKIRELIRELDEKIVRDEGEKLELEIKLNKLRLSEFEEDIKETQNQQFLKG
jgi:hypothetical protein